MPNGVKTYKIQINGLDVAISQVDALTARIADLEKRIDALNKSQGVRRVVSATAGTSSTTSSRQNTTSQLTAEEKNLQQISKIQQDIQKSRDASYQSVLKEREQLKQVQKEQSNILATQRLQNKEYDNTMEGLKQQLSDIKKVMQTVDLSSDEFGNLVKQADALNTKLSEVEQSYGQFGRNVGNYKSATEDFKQIEITVGETVRTFNSAREATRTLSNELKSMAAQGQRGTKQYKELERAVRAYSASLEDVQSTSQLIDDLTDAITSFTAIGSIGQGFSALFGINDAEIQQSINRLLAFQNILQGIEQLRMQFQRKELFGNFFNSFIDWANNIADRLTGVKKQLQELPNEANAAASKISRQSSVTQTMSNTNNNSVSTTVSAKAYVSELENVQTAANSAREAVDQMNKNITESNNSTKASTSALGSSLKQFSSDFKNAQKVIDEETKKYGNTLKDSKPYEIAVKNLNLLELQYSSIKSTLKDKSLSSFEIDELNNLDELKVRIAAARTEVDRLKKSASDASIDSDRINKSVESLSDSMGKTATKASLLSKSLTVLKNGFRSLLSATVIGLGIAAVSVVLDELISLIQKGVEAFTKFVKGDADIVDANKLVEDSINRLTSSYERLNEQIAKDYLSGRISQEEYYARTIDATTQAIQRQIDALKTIEDDDLRDNLRGVEANAGRDIGSTWFKQIKIDDINEAKDYYEKFREAAEKGEDAFKSWYTTASDTKDELTNIGQVIIGDFIARFQQAMNLLKTDAEAGKKEISELFNEFNNDDITNSVLLNLDQYIPDENVRKRIQGIIDSFQRLAGAMDLSGSARTLEQIERSQQLEIDAMKDGFAKRQAQRNLNERKELQDLTLTEEDKRNIRQKYANERQEDLNTEYEQYSAKVKAAEDNLAQLRVEAMREGYNKQLAELHLERDNRIKAAKESGIQVGEQVLLIQKIYNQREFNMMVEHYREMQNLQKEFEKSRQEIQNSTFQRYNDSTLTNAQTQLDSLRFQMPTDYNSQDLSKRFDSIKVFYNNMLSAQEAYVKKTLEIQKNQYAQEYDNQKQSENERYKQAVGSYNGTYLENIFKQYQDIMDGENAPFGTNIDSFFSKYDESLKNWLYSLEDSLKKGKITIEEYNKIVDNDNAKAYLEGNQSFVDYMQNLQAEYTTHTNAMKSLQNQYNAQIIAADEEARKTQEQNTADSYNKILQEVSSAFGQIQMKMQNVYARNDWQIINISKTKQNLDEVKTAVQQTLAEIQILMGQATNAFNSKEITFDQYSQLMTQLQQLGIAAKTTLKQVTDEGENIVPNFIQSMQQYINAVGQGLQQILSQLGQQEQAEYQYRLEQLQDYIDKYEEKMQEQQEIAEESASNIDSIESELENARGSRREALIDQLNAEIAKQRQAAAEEKRLEKEKQQLEKQSEKLEEEQAQKQKQRDLQQAIISSALAVVNALATKPFIPTGLAMAALAASLGAAQVAIISNTKYADGGLLNGKSHAQGGIPVGNTGIEVEGNEYVTNKRTTMANLDLMNFINSKRRRLNIDDFVEFYSSKGKFSSSINPLSKYANGGNLPTMQNMSLDKSFTQALAEYNDRPVVVSVVDVIKKSDEVRKVQTLAGIK